MELSACLAATPRHTMEVRLAREPEELLAAQRLRYEVFNLHEGLGLASAAATGVDEDRFDAHCDHLLVVDHEAGRVVGTYRLLPQANVPPFGFYSETEFDLAPVKRSGLRLLELGRSCVHPDYRYGRIIDLLFRGIGEYIRRTGSQALMGCVSVPGRDVAQLRQIYHWARQADLMARPELHVRPLPTHAVPGVEQPPDAIDPAIADALPALFRAYLAIGCRICSLPAYDAEFGTTDFFILVEIARMDGAYARRFVHGG